MRYKRLNPSDLPLHSCFFKMESGLRMYGKLCLLQGSPYFHDDHGWSYLDEWPVWYADPRDLPEPGTVKLDWFQDGMKTHNAIIEGMMFNIYRAYIDKPFEAQVSMSGLNADTRHIGYFSTLPEAKEACESFAAKLL